MRQNKNSSHPTNASRPGASAESPDFWLGDEGRRHRLFRAFESATGWKLDPTGLSADRPASSQNGADAGSLIIESAIPRPPVARSQAELLASEMNWLMRELETARRTVWQREAELAAGVPVRKRVDEEAHLAARLEAIIQGGAEAVSCQAAGVYLLDAATTELKLRACWGLPRNKLLEPARPLRGSVADLEALLGHAVVIEQTSMLPFWKVPEQCAAAACVPISSPTEPLGTLWVFCNQTRDFSASQTNLLEIIAGRIASELQRDMLLTECSQTRSIDQQLSAATAWQRDREPSLVPLVEGWQVAGFTTQSEYPGGSFYDWWVASDGHLMFTVGRAGENSLRGALSAAELRGILYAVAAENRDCLGSIRKVNELLLEATPKCDDSSLGLIRVAPESGEADFSIMGDVGIWHLGGTGRNTGIGNAPQKGKKLGEASDQRLIIQPGDSLLLATASVDNRADQKSIAQLLSGSIPSHGPLHEQAALMRDTLAASHPGCNLSLTVVQRD